MRATKLPSLCFQFPPALLFFLFYLGCDEEKLVNILDDARFTHSRPSLSFVRHFPTIHFIFCLVFLFFSFFFYFLTCSLKRFQLGADLKKEGEERAGQKEKCPV